MWLEPGRPPGVVAGEVWEVGPMPRWARLQRWEFILITTRILNGEVPCSLPEFLGGGL